MDVFIVILVLLDAVNLAEFVLFGIDKRRAIVGGQRIPELWLLGLAIVGGSIGGIAGMFVFHHKTRKMRFRVGLPVILITEFLFFLGVVWAAGL